MQQEDRDATLLLLLDLIANFNLPSLVNAGHFYVNVGASPAPLLYHYPRRSPAQSRQGSRSDRRWQPKHDIATHAYTGSNSQKPTRNFRADITLIC